jgi:hypothetical protein
MLDLIGEAAQCIVAEFRRFVAHGMRAATKPIGNAAQDGGHGRPGASAVRFHGQRGASHGNIQIDQAWCASLETRTKIAANPHHLISSRQRFAYPRISANFSGSGVLDTTGKSDLAGG